MKRLDWFIARRYLASRRKGRFLSLITLIAIGGIFVGVAALITVIAVMTGLQTDLQQKILGTNPHIFVFQQGRNFRMEDWRGPLQKVRATQGVVAAEPFIMSQVVVVVPGVQYAQAGMLYGIQLDSSVTPMTVIERQIREGKLSLGPTSTGYPPLLVGRGLADKLGVYAGDTVVVASVENVKQDPLGNLMPKMLKFEVTGRFSTGMYEYDNNNLYTRLSPAQELVGLGDGVSGLAVNVQDPWKAGAVRARLDDELGFPLWTSDWMQLNSSLFSALKLEKMAMAVILFLIVLVAAFNIISTLIMVVTDKTREIGILKAMGMTAGRILRVFILQGVVIGLVGTFLGTGAGLFLVWLLGKYKFISLPGDVYFIDTLPVALEPQDVIMIVALSILIAFVATIYPARQASRLEPVEAIRYE